MPKLRELSTREVQKRLKKLGFIFYRQGKGSHEIWARDEDGKIIPVPSYKGKNIRKGTIAAIIRELGLGVEDFMKL